MIKLSEFVASLISLLILTVVKFMIDPVVVRDLD
jgi:hypothetical protein